MTTGTKIPTIGGNVVPEFKYEVLHASPIPPTLVVRYADGRADPIVALATCTRRRLDDRYEVVEAETVIRPVVIEGFHLVVLGEDVEGACFQFTDDTAFRGFSSGA